MFWYLVGSARISDWHLVCSFIRKISEDRYSKDEYKKKVNVIIS